MYLCSLFMDTLKRLISWSFVVLANLILLAHSVVPHHHHDCLSKESVCFNLNESSVVSFQSHHVAHFTIANAGDVTLTHSCFKMCDNPILFVIFQILLLFSLLIAACMELLFTDFIVPLVCNEGKRLYFKPFINFYRMSCPVESAGLRAPPIY